MLPGVIQYEPNFVFQEYICCGDSFSNRSLLGNCRDYEHRLLGNSTSNYLITSPNTIKKSSYIVRPPIRREMRLPSECTFFFFFFFAVLVKIESYNTKHNRSILIKLLLSITEHFDCGCANYGFQRSTIRKKKKRKTK